MNNRQFDTWATSNGLSCIRFGNELIAFVGNSRFCIWNANEGRLVILPYAVANALPQRLDRWLASASMISCNSVEVLATFHILNAA